MPDSHSVSSIYVSSIIRDLTTSSKGIPCLPMPEHGQTVQHTDTYMQILRHRAILRRTACQQIESRTPSPGRGSWCGLDNMYHTKDGGPVAHEPQPGLKHQLSRITIPMTGDLASVPVGQTIL